MTDPLTPDRLAELRRIASGEDWSPAQPEDLGALLGEIDRLTDELGLVTAERDHLRDTQLQWIARDAAKMAARAQEFSQKATRIATLAASLPQGAPQPGADSPRAASVANETSGPEFVAQRPAEDFRTYRCPTPCDTDCEAPCHEVHQVGYKRTHSTAECQVRRAAAEQITPEDEGIATSDIGAQIAADSEPPAGPQESYEGTWEQYLAECDEADRQGLPRPEQPNAVPPQQPWPGLKRTPEQWCGHYGVQVHDPDGWRTPGDPRDWNEPITLAEFARRLSGSTLRNVSDPAWSQIRQDARAYCPDCGHPETNCACG